jgi:hypothetical protein
MDEKRKHKRYSVAYPLECDKDGKELTLTLIDVSKGGVSFNSPRQIAENERVKVKMFLKTRMFNLPIEVVRSRKVKEDLYSAGARFLEAPDEFFEHLEKEIQEITQQHRESNLYKRKNVSFQKASQEYLEK